MRRRTIIVIGLFAIAGAAAYFRSDIAKLRSDLHIKVLDYEQPAKTVWLKQNVSESQLRWYYHADQGTRTFSIPYEWFMALEQPTIPWLLFTAAPRLSETGYLARYGFIPDTVIPGKPADVLPIGLAHGGPMLDATGTQWRNPTSKADMTGIGLTCSACHTGSFTYKNTQVVIDGGPAFTNLFEFQKGIGLSLLLTRYWPGRFSRFADAILGKDASVDDRFALRAQLDLVLQQYGKVKSLEGDVAANSVEEGYARLDALNRIGNQVFSLDLQNPKNYASHSAPVHYPRIWNTPWFDWVQYNGSIMQPMVRNAGEALGVSAEINLTDPSKGLYKSSVNFKVLDEMEAMIKGDPPTEKGFTGLASPKWPADILPPIDTKLAARGAELYKQICQECHRPPVTDKAFFDFNNKDWWTRNSDGQPVLRVENVPIKHVGTDPAQAEDMANRTVALPPNLGIKDTGFGLALGDLVENTVNYYYDRLKPSPDKAERERLNGGMPNEIRAELAYKVRPLNGVWATPPYLHNGSVPTIHALLSPVKERPQKFYVGSREYDPKDLGYAWRDSGPNRYEFDTSKRGNFNIGHEFSNEKREGVIGRALTEDERRALIEYIKTM